MRQIVGKAVAVRLNDLEPAPAAQGDLLSWYFDIVDRINCADRHDLKRLHKTRSHDYWLVFSAAIPDGVTMFAIHWQTRSRGALPTSAGEAEDGGWTATMPTESGRSQQASLIPRGGGSLDLSNKSVLLVGCGSVGSELALRLTSAGAGRLTVTDPDTLSEENLYRHSLTVNNIGRLKAEGLAHEIALKHPWADVTHWHKSLEELRSPAKLSEFDLIVIAIGAPNVERAFAEYCTQERLKCR